MDESDFKRLSDLDDPLSHVLVDDLDAVELAALCFQANELIP